MEEEEKKRAREREKKRSEQTFSSFSMELKEIYLYRAHRMCRQEKKKKINNMLKFRVRKVMQKGR